MADGASLLDYLDAAFLVGDPEGRLVYVNPAFERRFGVAAAEIVGEPVSERFSGGGRESILGAVAEVCGKGETVRFRLREAGQGFLGVASPIDAPAGAGSELPERVGVAILLFDEPELDQRLLAVQNEISEPLDEAMAALELMIEETGGRRSEQFRSAVETGLGAVARARKWTEELMAALEGRPAKAPVDSFLDPVRLLRQATARVASQFVEAGIGLDLLVPAQLPSARGDEDVIETALVRLLRLRVATAAPGTAITFGARSMGSGAGQALLISIVDRPRALVGGEGPEEREPRSLTEAVEALGGRVHTVIIPDAGRATAVRLPIAPSR